MQHLFFSSMKKPWTTEHRQNRACQCKFCSLYLVLENVASGHITTLEVLTADFSQSFSPANWVQWRKKQMLWLLLWKKPPMNFVNGRKKTQLDVLGRWIQSGVSKTYRSWRVPATAGARVDLYLLQSAGVHIYFALNRLILHIHRKQTITKPNAGKYQRFSFKNEVTHRLTFSLIRNALLY